MKNMLIKSKLFKMMFVLMFLSLTSGRIFATGYPVFDIAGLMNGINQLYAVYDQINTTIEQVQNTYKQLETQIKQIENMNWDDLANSFSAENWSEKDGFEGVWENIGNFRNNLTNATSAINANINLFNDVKNTLENKTVTCMGKQYSVAGLFGIGKYGQNNLMNLPASALDYVKNVGKEIAKGYTGELTYKEKQAIMDKWGLDPENYAYVKLVEEQSNDLIQTLFTKGSEEWYTKELTQAAETNKGLTTLLDQAAADGSMMKEMQATSNIILSLKGDILNLIHGVRETGAAFATEKTREKVMEETQKEREALEKEKRRKKYMEATGYVSEWL